MSTQVPNPKDNKDTSEKPETPKMAKPVTGQFEQSRKKLGGMIKKGRKTVTKKKDLL